MTSLVQRATFIPVGKQRQGSRAGLGTWLVILAAMFNIVMCFINTHGWLRVNATELAVIELLIMMAGFMRIWRFMDTRMIIVTGLSVAYMIGAKLINPSLSLKIVHDLAIIWIFFQLGKIGGMEQGRLAVKYTVILTLFFAGFEFLLPVQYGAQFNIWQYYVQKGGLSADTVNYSNTTSFVSGSRGGAMSRTYFPSIFGSRRIASIFLEPVSIGNLAAIIFCWCLATSRNIRGQREIGLYLSAFCCIVLGDSRFATAFCVVAICIRLSPVKASSLVTFLMPICVMVLLIVVGSLHELPDWLPKIVHDDFSGRLLFSGQLLDYWQIPQWFGLAPSPVYTADTGYAYIANSMGIIFPLVIWFLFSFSDVNSKSQAYFRTLISVYFATSLSIGASIFTIKTAALLWFLYGACATLRKPNDSLVEAGDIH